MRKKILQSAILVLAMAFMVGCSSDDSSSNGGGDNGSGNNGGGNNGGGDNGGGDNGGGDTAVYQYVQKILVEDITSASCVWCPLATFATEEIAKSELGDKIISVAAHDDFNPNLVRDPFVLPGIRDLVRAVKLTGYPFVAWNRNTTIKGTAFQSFIPERRIDGKPQYVFDASLFATFHSKNNLFQDSSPIGIKIESDLTNTNGSVKVSLKFGADLNQDLKYVVYIIEDGLKFQQANVSTLYGNDTGEGRWEMDFIHNQVVRATNNFLGEAIAAGESVTTNEFKTTSNLSYTVANLDNVSVVVAILDKNGNVLNAQKAKANTTQDYQIVE
ncbi:Omp28-related outer membrane protein [Myroides sp. WP-1]|uniref:Omp28-related outer membrane protein n=1 Tax=Myroides sp. WP-1 TaxID=2759944 RepID=UPI0015F9960D|nr:Omp28-related outer membrane protein [Myroides sp. WP-1]MBB1139500.1 Omp28-related outer membrane protein [Myroides sp. WP-1]